MSRSYRLGENYVVFFGVLAARLDNGRWLIRAGHEVYSTSLEKHHVLDRLKGYLELVRANGRIGALARVHLGPVQAACLYLAGDLPDQAFNRAIEGTYPRSVELPVKDRRFIDVPFVLGGLPLRLCISVRAAHRSAGFDLTDAEDNSLLPS